jgi:hypothetical protein
MGSKRFSTQDMNKPLSKHMTHDDQRAHLMEIQSPGQMPTTKQLREMTESKRMALGYGPDQSRRFENRPTKSQYASSSNLHRGYDPYQQQEQRAYHGGHESNFNSAAKPTSSRRQMIPAAPIQLISSNERQKLTNPNINNKDFNPITHTNGYRQEGTFA